MNRITPGHFIADYVVVPLQGRAFTSALQKLEGMRSHLVENYFDPSKHESILRAIRSKITRLDRVISDPDTSPVLKTKAISLAEAYRQDITVKELPREDVERFAQSFLNSYFECAKEVLDVNHPDLNLADGVIELFNTIFFALLTLGVTVKATILTINHATLYSILLSCIADIAVFSIAFTIIGAILAICISHRLAPSFANTALDITLYHKALELTQSLAEPAPIGSQIVYIFQHNLPSRDGSNQPRKATETLISELIPVAIKIGRLQPVPG